MKIRHGFVSNSSSSSFIFGVLDEKHELQTEEIIQKFKDSFQILPGSPFYSPLEETINHIMEYNFDEIPKKQFEDHEMLYTIKEKYPNYLSYRIFTFSVCSEDDDPIELCIYYFIGSIFEKEFFFERDP